MNGAVGASLDLDIARTEPDRADRGGRRGAPILCRDGSRVGLVSGG